MKGLLMANTILSMLAKCFFFTFGIVLCYHVSSIVQVLMILSKTLLEIVVIAAAR